MRNHLRRALFVRKREPWFRINLETDLSLKFPIVSQALNSLFWAPSNEGAYEQAVYRWVLTLNHASVDSAPVWGSSFSALYSYYDFEFEKKTGTSLRSVCVFLGFDEMISDLDLSRSAGHPYLGSKGKAYEEDVESIMQDLTEMALGGPFEQAVLAVPKSEWLDKSKRGSKERVIFVQDFRTLVYLKCATNRLFHSLQEIYQTSPNKIGIRRFYHDLKTMYAKYVGRVVFMFDLAAMEGSVKAFMLELLYDVRARFVNSGLAVHLRRLGKVLTSGTVYMLDGSHFKFSNKNPSGTGATLNDNTDIAIALILILLSEFKGCTIPDILRDEEIDVIGDGGLFSLDSEDFILFPPWATNRASELGFTIKFEQWSSSGAYGLEFCGATVDDSHNIVSTNAAKTFAALYKANDEKEFAEILANIEPILANSEYDPVISYLRSIFIKLYPRYFISSAVRDELLCNGGP